MTIAVLFHALEAYECVESVDSRRCWGISEAVFLERLSVIAPFYVTGFFPCKLGLYGFISVVTRNLEHDLIRKSVYVQCALAQQWHSISGTFRSSVQERRLVFDIVETTLLVGCLSPRRGGPEKCPRTYCCWRERRLYQQVDPLAILALLS